MTAAATPTLTDVTSWIAGNATETDLDALIKTINNRARINRSITAATRAATVSVGDTVRLEKLTPRALNDLTGTVTSINGTRVSVELDTASTLNLSFARVNLAVAASAARAAGNLHTVHGVPVSCCAPTA